MHLLATQTGVIDDNAEAVDLAQTPGDIVIISAADSELASLARAHDAITGHKPSLRLANLMALGHNLSVDTYIETTLSQAKLIIVRCLGGLSYWSYGIEQLISLAGDKSIKLALLPGGADPDPVGAVEPMDRETRCLDRARQPVTARVDERHLDVDVAACQPDREIGDDPFDPTEVEPFGDQQYARLGHRVSSERRGT